MNNESGLIDEKRAHKRLPICRKIRFATGGQSHIGLIGDLSIGGVSIISKHRFIQGAIIELAVPPMSGTVQYCMTYGKDFFKVGIRLLPSDSFY
jgi:hypothetical protein